MSEPFQPDAPSETVRNAIAFLANVAMLLKHKNKSYGDSITNPIRVFSTSDSLEQIRVRIDDKLSRILRAPRQVVAGAEQESERDTLTDLVGYLALLAAATYKGQ